MEARLTAKANRNETVRDPPLRERPSPRGVSPQQAADRLAVLIDPEIYRLTVGVRGWTPKQHEDWLAELLIASLLPAGKRH
jgi:hypothetical protein